MEYTKQPLKDATKCVGCGHTPIAIHYDYDMWYIQCGNPDCTKYGKYLFLGQTKDLAVEQWERANRPINRYYQKRKKDESDGQQPTVFRKYYQRHKK